MTAGSSIQCHLTGMSSPNLIQHGCQQYKGTWSLHTATTHLLGSARKGSDTDTEKLLPSFSLLSSFKQGLVHPFTRKVSQYTLHCLTHKQPPLEELDTRTLTQIHIHIYHTLCWRLTLSYTVVMATPLRKDSQAATLVKSACLFYISCFMLSHTPSFSFTASHFYLSPSIVRPPPLLVAPLVHLSTSLHYLATFSSSHLPPCTSQANVNTVCHFTYNSHRVYI